MQSTEHLDAICQRIENTKARAELATGKTKERLLFAVQMDEQEKRQEMDFLNGGPVDSEIDALSDDEIYERLFGTDDE